MKASNLLHRGVWIGVLGVMASWVQSATVSDYQASPPELTQNAAPLVLFALGVDHQLFKKAYTDHSDLTGDGTYNTTYEPTFDYIGYFNHELCYTYASGEFSPSTVATSGDQCAGTSDFSGNFMNWATMTRIDILRTVLYGGTRITDTTDKTVVERSYLAEDLHAFAKPISGTVAELKNYLPDAYLPSTGSAQLTLCNLSLSTTGAPLIRIAEGLWQEWSATEKQNCQWHSERAESSNPQESDNAIQSGTKNALQARIVKCDSAIEGPGYPEICRRYPNGKYKPIGMLQSYGEDGRIRFGLMSGSYHQNHRGGLLRKQLSFFGGNGDNTHDEIDLTTGQFRNLDASIVDTVDTLRLAKYNHGNAVYDDCNEPGIPVSSYLSDVGSGYHCANWGNPLAEIYLEALRYISGTEEATSAFNASRSGYSEDNLVSGLGSDIWDDPYTIANECARCSVVVISAGNTSFDGDDLGSITGLAYKSGTFSLSKLQDDFTNPIGSLEYDFTQKIFDGGGSSCSATTLANLSDALGICPGLPQQQGTYHLAGLAYYARTQDLRPDLDGVQTVQTFAMQLAEALPRFEFEVGSQSVVFTPFCNSQAQLNGIWRGCSIGDVVVEKVSDTYGRLVVVWENSLWGNDFDMDAIHVIEWCVGNVNCDEVNGEWGSMNSTQFRVRNSMRSCSAGSGLHIGMNLSGAGGNDGLAGDWQVTRDEGCWKSAGQTDSDVPGPVTSGVLTAEGSSPAITLDDPLWLAAKYGGFRDADESGTPVYDPDNTGSSISDIEWDARDNETGAAEPDGIPDNYYLARNPAQFREQLDRVLSSMVARVASGSNAAVVSNTRSGTGAIYQAIYQPRRTMGGSVLTWTGELQGIFIDGNNELREGGPSLLSYTANPRITVGFDEDLGITVVQRYSTTDGGNTFVPEGEPVPLSELNALWKGGEELSKVGGTIEEQREYDGSANLGRYILANVGGSVVPFTSTGEMMTGGHWQLTGVAEEETAKKVIDYSRGKEVAGYRSRTFRDDAGQERVWRLGDIIHSSPAVVDRPSGVYDTRFNDGTYSDFKEKYANRRRMVYVGANDGMLHAFNGGFWDPVDQAFKLKVDDETPHPLGSELWAFVPRSTLPHLQWLTDPDYPHVYYVDGDPVTFDARIFTPSETHPHGWGTVLVVGMRLGGGPIEVNGETIGSSYLILDVTDPEQPPNLIAEISHQDLGYTTSVPQLVKNYKGRDLLTAFHNGFDEPQSNQWRLVFGSGPNGTNALSHGTSEQTAKVFMYDLGNAETAPKFLEVRLAGSDVERQYHSMDANSLVGNPLVVDLNQDAVDNVVYFGIASGSQNDMDGALYRWLLDENGLSSGPPNVMLPTHAPVLAQPSFASIDDLFWLYVGSGKLLGVEDTHNAEQQYFYGLLERYFSDGETAITMSNVVDTSQVRVFKNGAVRELNGGSLATYTPEAGINISTYEELKRYIQTRSGWRVRMESGTWGVAPSGRVTRASTIFDDLIFFPEYVPSQNVCDATGNSYLWGLSLLTGTSTPNQPLGANEDEPTLSAGGDPGDEELEPGNNKVDLGYGEASSVTLLQDESGEQVTAVTTSSDGSIDLTDINPGSLFQGRQSWREVNINF